MLSNDKIIENRDSQNLAYILKDPDLFFPTGYKVLQSQAKNGFVKCTRVMHNGMNKLVFDISEYKTLDSLLPTLRPEIYTAILKNLMDAIIDVKNNGFIHCTNIEISFDKIFIDCNNFKVYLVYLPIDTPVRQNDYEIFEATLKTSISGAIGQFSNLQTEMTSQLREILQDPGYTLERFKEMLSDTHADPAKFRPVTQRSLVMTDNESKSDEEEPLPAISSAGKREKSGFLNGFFKGKTKEDKNNGKTAGKNGVNNKGKTPRGNSTPVNLQSEIEGGATEILDDIFAPSLILSGVKTPVKIDILINKPEFLIGKKDDAVDGVIACNNAISRVHCKIVFESGKYYAIDLGSANGTYINGVRLLPDQKIQVKDKDKVQLANSVFLLKSV